jgi:hypothetical protein
MSKGRHLFKKTDLARVVKGVQELDLSVKCVRITADGQIEVEVGAAQAEAQQAGEWQDWTPADDKRGAA